jgi:hypothetical protein
MVGRQFSYLDKVNLFAGIYARLFGGIFRFSWWSPFFLYALFQMIGFLALLWYYAPGLSAIVYPLLSSLLPPGVFHYPQYYLALPSIFASYQDYLLGITVWIVLTAAAVYRLGGIYAGKRLTLKDGIVRALRSYLPLFAIWLLETVLVIAILYVPNLLLKNRMAGSPKFSAVINVFFELIGLVATSMLIYSVPGIILDRKGLARAVGDSISLFFDNMIFTYSIVAIPGFLHIILNLLLSNFAPTIISRFNPELIPDIMLFYIVSGIFINLFIYGAAVFGYKRITE